jgi:hypothetical protein
MQTLNTKLSSSSNISSSDRKSDSSANSSGQIIGFKDYIYQKNGSKQPSKDFKKMFNWLIEYRKQHNEFF